MLKFGIVAILLVWAGIASAQVDPDEALKALQAREAAAATQPSDPNAEIAHLKSVITDQAAQIDALKTQIKEMKREDALVASAADKPLAADSSTIRPTSTFSSRYTGTNDSEREKAKVIDDAIDKYVRDNGVDPEIAAELYEGIPKIGMTMDEMNLIVTLEEQSESIAGFVYIAEPRHGWVDPVFHHWVITTVHGTAIAVAGIRDTP